MNVEWGSQISAPEIKNSVIAELEKPLEVLLDKLREKIKRQEYDFLLGDDLGGRIPALILGRVINGVYERKGLPRIPLIFLQGPGWEGAPPTYTTFLREELKQRMVFLRGDAKKRALLITEHIRSGQTIRTLGELLTEKGIPFDVASISISGAPEYYYTKGILKPDTKLFWATHRVPFIDFWSRWMTGLARGECSNPKVIKDSGVRGQAWQARVDVGILSDRLINYYFSPAITRKIAGLAGRMGRKITQVAS